MENPDPPLASQGVDSEQFNEWLERTAESHEISTDELLEQLISSYWTLTEMTDGPEGSEGVELAHPLQIGLENESEVVTRSEFETFVSDVELELADIGQHLDAIEAQLETDDGDAIAELERWIDSEFAILRRILGHLIDETAANSSEIETLDRLLTEEIAPIREEQTKLAQLRQRAMDLGLKEADCDGCGERVDLSMLPFPACPTCGEQFADISPRKSFLGIGYGSNLLTTKESGDAERSRRRDSGEGNSSSTETEAATQPSTPPKEDRIGGFEWVSDRK